VKQNTKSALKIMFVEAIALGLNLRLIKDVTALLRRRPLSP
jgi:hypothetical protein